MSQARIARGLVIGATASALLALAACSGGTPATTASGSAGSADCAAYEQYGDLSGKTVSIFTSIASDSEAQRHIDS